MKSLRHIFLYCIIFFNNAPLASEIDNSYQSQSLLAVLFKRTSAEFKANTFQVYSSAQKNIDKALSIFFCAEEYTWKVFALNSADVRLNKTARSDCDW